MIPTRKQIDQLQESMKDKGAKTDDDAGEKSNKGSKVGEKKDQWYTSSLLHALVLPDWPSQIGNSFELLKV